MSTQAGVAHTVTVGYLRTHTSRAMAQLTCMRPCACAPTNLSASTRSGEHTSTTVFSAPVHVRVERGVGAVKACTLALQLLTDGTPFKFSALQVQV